MSSFLNKKRLFISEILIFLLIQILGLLTGWQMWISPEWREAFKFSPYTLGEFLIGFAAALLFVLIFLKIFQKRDFPFRLLFYFLVFLTGSIVFLVWLPEVLAIGLVIILFLILHFRPNILVQNLAVSLMCIGAAAFLGLGFEPKQLIIILIILAVYDIVAVFVSGHMIKMFKEMVGHKLVLALTIPTTLKGWLTNISQVKVGQDFMFLGTGDLVLPLALAISSLRHGLISSVFVILGSGIGMAILVWYFLSQKEKRALPALPPIIVGSILGYLISFL